MNTLMVDKYQGCLLGIAIGDALGAPVEFMRINEIIKRYGKDGVTDFYTWGGLEPGSYTDDTQMSIATANGCIQAHRQGITEGNCPPPSDVYNSYLDWLESQSNPHQRRGPGNTCLTALGSGKMGTIKDRINNSKGCGGVMRTAPVGLAFPSGTAFQMGAECAAITHGHPSGYLTGGFIAEMISHLVGGTILIEAIDKSIQCLVTYEEHHETLANIELARELSDKPKPIQESIELIGEGWIGEEALAISIFCALKFSSDWAAGVLAAVNHSGDSDSTGSIAGAILGTILGINSIPSNWVNSIEDSPKLRKIASDLYKVVRKEDWKVYLGD